MNVNISTADQNGDNNALTSTFEDAVTSNTTTLKLTINTDNKGNQTRWIVRDSNNTAIQQGNNYGNNQTYVIDITVPGNDCYSLRILDTGNDGGASISLADTTGQVLIESDGNYGSGFTSEFKQGQLGVNEQDLSAINIYPNPSKGVVNLSSDKKIDNVMVYDLSGKLIHTMNNLLTNKTQVDLSAFGKGTYVVRIETGKTITTKKVIIK